MLNGILAVRHAQLLIQITNMCFDGGGGHVQLTGNLLVAVAGIDKPQHLPFALSQRAGANKFRHLRVVQQTFNEALVKVGEFMPVMLVNIAQNTLGAVLLSSGSVLS